MFIHSIPIMALVDGDTYGIDILSVYKHGSISLQHENAKLAAERVEWLGVWASELELCVFVCTSTTTFFLDPDRFRVRHLSFVDQRLRLRLVGSVLIETL